MFDSLPAATGCLEHPLEGVGHSFFVFAIMIKILFLLSISALNIKLAKTSRFMTCSPAPY